MHSQTLFWCMHPNILTENNNNNTHYITYHTCSLEDCKLLKTQQLYVICVKPISWRAVVMILLFPRLDAELITDLRHSLEPRKFESICSDMLSIDHARFIETTSSSWIIFSPQSTP